MFMQSAKISVFKAVMMGINIMVGAGILASPDILTKSGGSSSFLVWVLCAAIMLPIVYSVARLPEVFPGNGGFVSYYEAGLGKVGGFLGGWLYLMVYVFAGAGVVMAFSLRLSTTFPSFAAWWYPPLFVALILGVVFFYNLLPLATIASISSALTFVKLIPVLCAIVFLPFFLKSAPTVHLDEVVKVPGLVGLALFALVGFESLTSIADVIEGGPRAARKAILIAFGAVSLLYTLFHFSLLAIMGVDGLAAYGGTGYTHYVAQVVPFIGKLIVLLLPVTMIVTFMNSSCGIVLLNSITIEAMARDRMLRSSKILSSRLPTGRPLVAVLLGCASVYAAAIAVGDVASLFKVSGFVTMTIITIVLGILAFREQGKSNYVDRGICVLGIIEGIGMLLYIVSDLGPTAISRLIVLAPFLVGLGMGALLVRPAGFHEKKATQDFPLSNT